MRRLIGHVILLSVCLSVTVPAVTQAQTQPTPGPPPITTFSVQGFQSDLFTGAATSEIPIMVSPGTAGVAPKIVLRYNSSVVDEIDSDDQAQWSGLGWTLDVGGFVLRDTKGTTDTADDTFKLVFGGDTHELVSAGGGSYRAKEETFWLINYVSAGDYWTVKTKDGTTHRFGFNTDSKATGLTFGPNIEVPVTFRYYIDEATTTSGTAVHYSYFKQSSSYNAKPYDQAVYPDTITYSYHSGTVVGPAREVRFFRASRTDWTDTSGSTHTSYHELSLLDSIEVRVGGGLVRKYAFSYDYSIDRDPAHTWGGGATGDLTLKTVTMFGSDGVSSLPALTFAYNTSGRLASANNGIGGTVGFAYDKVASIPVYPVCVQDAVDTGQCTQEALATYSRAVPTPPPAGYILTSAMSGTLPVYPVCVQDAVDTGQCAQEALATSAPCCPPPAGYIYLGKVDRHRVTSRTLGDGLGWTSTTTFNYDDLGLSSDGKDFHGHAKVRSTDPLGHYTDTFFKQDDLLKGHPYQIETRSSTGALFAQVTNTWATTAPAPGVTFVFLSRVDNYECDGQQTCLQTAKTFAYDSNGNPTQTSHLGEVALTGDERTENTDWSVDTTNWIHRPSHTTLLDSAGAVVRERWLSYDSRGLLTREESRLAGPQGSAGNPAVIHGYDAYGNKTSTTDPRGCTTSTTFDSSQTYPATVTTCLGHVTSFQYDARWGVITSQTDPNNQTTTSTYDLFGRLTRVTGPFDTTSTYGTLSRFYLDWGTPSLQRIQTFRTEQHGTGNVIWSEEYFDGLGRIDQTRQEGPGGQTILTETTFDSRGLVATKSAPHFSTEAAVLTRFEYDVLGRQTKVTHPDTTFATTNFIHDVITTTDERGNVKRKYLDAYDRLERVDEVNGAETYATTYQYDAAGSLTRVTNHLGHVTTTAYDLMGRKLAMSDPNMGSWSYSYDLGGNLKTQTDAKNQTLNFDYDLQSRLIRKIYPDARQITWTYDDLGVAFSKGRLTRVVDLSATTNFFYDQLGRVSQTQRVIDSVTHTMSQSYDALGRVVSETFPDDPQPVSYNYNEAGWLSTIPGFVSSISYNARGQKTSMQYANSVTTTWTYDPTNFRVTHRETGGGAAPAPRVALSRWVKSWTVTQTLTPFYRAGICVANSTGSCIGGDATAESGVGPVIGYMKTSADPGTAPAYRSTCYSDTAGVCTGWGLSLDVNGAAVGYLSTTAPDTQSGSAPFIQSGGILLQGLTGTASAYLWSASTEATNHTGHIYNTDGTAPTGYTSEGTTGYLLQTTATGTAPLYRFVNSSTGHHYYSTTTDQPAGFTLEATLGYLRTSTGLGLVALYRHYNATTGDYLLNTTSTPPSGYALQVTLGYIYTTAGGSGGPFQNLTYGYDAGGNITTITDTLFTGGRSFSYDALNRLTQATGNFGTNQALVTHNYSYNAIGNILEKAGVLYSYGDPNHPSAVTSTSDGKSYSYDANGNMATGGNRTYIWDPDNRLDTVTTGGASSFMSYDYTGIRVKKDGSGGITTYPFSGYEIDPNGVTTKYIRIGIENVAAKKSTGETLFYHNDHLGGVNVITDDWGSRVQLIEYDPWGKVSREEGIGDASRRFTGHMLDPESGLYYYGGRYYDPELGRFISPDPFVGQPDDPQNLNRYSYVINNSVNNIDPDGYFHQVKKKKKKGGFFRSFFGRLLVSIVAGVITGGIAGVVAEAAGFAASTVSTIANTAAGIAAGATMAGLSGGNPLLGGLIGGTFGFLTGGGLTGVQPGADFPVSPALSDAAGSGALFANFLGGRRGSAGDDFPGTSNPPLVLASHTGVQFGCMNPVATCEPLPPSRTQPARPDTSPLKVTKDPTFARCEDCVKLGADPSKPFTCPPDGICFPGGKVIPRYPNPNAPLPEKAERTVGETFKQILRNIFRRGGGGADE